MHEVLNNKSNIKSQDHFKASNLIFQFPKKFILELFEPSSILRRLEISNTVVSAILLFCTIVEMLHPETHPLQEVRLCFYNSLKFGGLVLTALCYFVGVHFMQPDLCTWAMDEIVKLRQTFSMILFKGLALKWLTAY